MPFEDIAPILYIHSRITKEDEDRRKIKHTVIDEVQDYSPLQIMAVRAYYRQADLTLLGDINQAINPLSNVGSMEVIKELTEEEEFNHIHMPKSYRSTFEITEFCNRLVGLKIDEQEAVNRHGPKPQVIPYESRSSWRSNCRAHQGAQRGTKVRRVDRTKQKNVYGFVCYTEPSLAYAPYRQPWRGILSRNIGHPILFGKGTGI